MSMLTSTCMLIFMLMKDEHEHEPKHEHERVPEHKHETYLKEKKFGYWIVR